MAQSRNRGVCGIAGERGRGKTSKLLKLFEAYKYGGVTVYDWDDDPMYDDYPVIPLEKVKLQESGAYKIQNPDWKLVIDTLGEKDANGKALVMDRAICLEDITSYIPNNEYKPLTSIMGSCRKLHIDLFLTMHQINRCPPFILQNLDMLTLFKTSDNLDQVVKDSIRKPELVEHWFAKIKADPDPFANVTIILNDGMIRGEEVPKSESILLLGPHTEQ